MLRATRGRRPLVAAFAFFRIGCVGVLAGLLALWGTGLAQANQTSTTTVSFTLAEVIEVLSWPSGAVSLAGAPDEAVISGPLSFRVRANAPWAIYIRSDSEDGRMREYDTGTGQYVAAGRALSRRLEWGFAPSGPWSPVSGADFPLVEGMPPTGAPGTIVEFYLRQTTTFEDVSLPAGREYRIVLTYTAGLVY